MYICIHIFSIGESTFTNQIDRWCLSLTQVLERYSIQTPEAIQKVNE